MLQPRSDISEGKRSMNVLRLWLRIAVASSSLKPWFALPALADAVRLFVSQLMQLVTPFVANQYNSYDMTLAFKWLISFVEPWLHPFGPNTAGQELQIDLWVRIQMKSS